ncbi:hypothetical protein DRQ15_08310, partial [candidate division KSB1 bacterium]
MILPFPLMIADDRALESPPTASRSSGTYNYIWFFDFLERPAGCNGYGGMFVIRPRPPLLATARPDRAVEVVKDAIFHDHRRL